MALHDILVAIQAEADRAIADAKSAHQRRLSALREESERRLAALRQRIAVQREEKKANMRRKVEALAVVEQRNAVLGKKKELLDRFYARDVVRELTALPKEQQEALLKTWLERMTEKNGTLHPAKAHEALIRALAGDRFAIGNPVEAAGGFLFVSPRQERDFTYEHIVASDIRPRTEVPVARALFSA